MVHSVSRWMQGVQVKLWDPLRTRAIPERLRGVFTTRHYTNPHLLYLISLNALFFSTLCKYDHKSWYCRKPDLFGLHFYLFVLVRCSDPSYLRRAGKAVFDAMLVADPSAIWSAYLLLLSYIWREVKGSSIVCARWDWSRYQTRTTGPALADNNAAIKQLASGNSRHQFI